MILMKMMVRQNFETVKKMSGLLSQLDMSGRKLPIVHDE